MQSFPKFSRFACAGDSVRFDVDGFTVTARLHYDDDPFRPDERDCGFWPSLDPKSAGYIGPKSPRTLARHLAKAKAVMKAWEAGEWFYCGVAVTVERDGVPLTGPYDNALWSIECNYPGSDNSYLSEVAGELLEEALDAARAKLAKLCECGT